jgi:pimeloyl-ACP methyl ester carboxylesterase
MFTPRQLMRSAPVVIRRSGGEIRSVLRAVNGYHRALPGLTFDGLAAAPSEVSNPVVLVHGAAHNRSAWKTLSQRLRAAGFGKLVALEYRVPRPLDDLAAELGVRLRAVLDETGASQLHIVGHSLGGLALRVWHDLGGGDRFTASAVTLGTPHFGTPWATLPGVLGFADIRPGSPILRRLESARTSHEHWTTIAGKYDVIVRASSAHLPDSQRIDISGVGHLGLLYSRAVAGHVCFALLAAEYEVDIGRAVGQ